MKRGSLIHAMLKQGYDVDAGREHDSEQHPSRALQNLKRKALKIISDSLYRVAKNNK
jgi:hypothetical protein